MAKILDLRPRLVKLTPEGRTPLPVTYGTKYPQRPLDDRIVRIKQMLERINELMHDLHQPPKGRV